MFNLCFQEPSMTEQKLKSFFDAANQILDDRAAERLREKMRREGQQMKIDRDTAEAIRREDSALQASQQALFGEYLKPALDSLKEKGAFDYEAGHRMWDSSHKWRAVPATSVKLTHIKTGQTFNLVLVNEKETDYSIGKEPYTSSTLEGALKTLAQTTLNWEPQEVEKIARRQKAPAL